MDELDKQLYDYMTNSYKALFSVDDVTDAFPDLPVSVIKMSMARLFDLDRVEMVTSKIVKVKK